jgi:hypothetical protein
MWNFFRNLLEWIGDYFTLQQILISFGGSAVMSAIFTWLISFLVSLGIVEKIFIGIGLTLLLVSLIIWLWSFVKKYNKGKRLKNKEWIAKNMPYLNELRLNLSKANQRVVDISNRLSEKNISYSKMEKCNTTYLQMVNSDMIKKPFSYTTTPDIKTARKIWNKTSRKIGKNMTVLLTGMNAFSEIMERENIGLAPSLKNDDDYQQLLSKISEQKAVANSKIATVITMFTDCSYGMNSTFIFYAYMQKALYKKDKRTKELIPEYFTPLPTVRRSIDNTLSVLLSNVEDVIEDSLDYEK